MILLFADVFDDVLDEIRTTLPGEDDGTGEEEDDEQGKALHWEATPFA